MGIRNSALAAAALLLLSSICPPPTQSTGSPEHRLMTVMAGHGIEVGLLSKQHHDACGALEGAYMPQEGEPALVICQEDVWDDFRSMVLRHEAIHAIQDCRDNDPKWPGWMAAGMTRQQSEVYAEKHGIDLDQFLVPYSMTGADDHELALEAEAYVLAQHLTTDQVIAEFNRVCRSA